MISKNTIKLIKSLAHKKYRQKHELFLVEGEKNVLEVLDSSLQVTQLFGTARFLQNNSGRITKADIVAEAGKNYSPAVVANYCYELVKEYNQFYHDHSILNASENNVRDFRLVLSEAVGKVIKSGMALLGIEMPERM